MHILIISQYFWPENFKINDIALGLKEKGHQVTVLTSLPNYPQGKVFAGYGFFKNRTQNWNGINIVRALQVSRGTSKGIRLAVNFISFMLLASIKALFLKGKYDCVLVFCTSPITSSIPAFIIRKKYNIPIYLWLQDLWPNTITATLDIKNKFIHKFTNWFSKLIHTSSDILLIQSEGFRDILHKQGVNSKKIIYFPNSTELFYYTSDTDTTSPKYNLPNGFNILFAGNIGYAQDFSTLISAAKKVKERNPNINWIVLGDGRNKKHVEQQIKSLDLDQNFILLGAYPSRDMPNFFARADVLIASLKSDFIFSITIPSKIQSYLACGKPIIAVLEGEGAKIVIEAGAGMASHPGDVDGLVNVVLTMASKSPQELKQMGESGKTYFLNHFERNMLVDKLDNILTSKH